MKGVLSRVLFAIVVGCTLAGVVVALSGCNPNTPIMRTLSGVDCSQATLEQHQGRCKYVR
jgi:hypothetical protein